MRDEIADEVEEERDVSVVAPKNFGNDNRRIRYGPAFEAVPTVGTRPRAFTHPLHKRLRFDVGEIFDSDCFPFCRVHPWGRNGRQMDLNALSSTTDALTTTSTDAPTTASTEATTTAAASTTISSTEATTTTATTTTESTTQMPATTTASATTEKQHNVDTLVEQVLQILLDSPEDTASAVTQLIRELQEKFAPTTPAPTTIADKTFNVTSIIESIAGLGLAIENVSQLVFLSTQLKYSMKILVSQKLFLVIPTLLERVRGRLGHPLRPAVVALPRGALQGGDPLSGLLALGRLRDGGVQEGQEHGAAGRGVRGRDHR